MCGLFGFSQYGETPIKNTLLLTEALAEESTERGIDATGIAFCENGRMEILKDSKSAYTMKLNHPANAKAVMGHTRHTTHGSEKLNYNNHPFGGRAKKSFFALAHNGILNNGKELSKRHKLPVTHIETDSYVAVQLIEKQRKLDFGSIRFMAEAVRGSFCFSILDDKNNLYLVKGDNPLKLMHFPKQKIYVYASTEEILWRALVSSPLFDALKKGDYEEIPLGEGDILKITPGGELEQDKYKSSYPQSYYPYSYSFFDDWYGDNTYLDELRCVAGSFGYEKDFVDEMLMSGFSCDEIEEYLYCN